jgi:hypothetical protein
MSTGLQGIPSFGSPTLEDFDTSNIQEGQRIGGRSNRQFVRFYTRKFSQVRAKSVRINEKTGATTVLETEVVPVERECVEIITPGDKNTVDDFAEDFHRREHWKAYKSYRDGNGVPVGKSLDECHEYISSGIATELRYLGCHTEEQLADASDLLCQRIPNGFELREFARAMVQAERENQSSVEVTQLRGQLSDSNRLIAELSARLEAVEQGQILDSRGQPVESPKKTRTKKVTEDESK